MVSKIGSRIPQGGPKTCPRSVLDANLAAPQRSQIQPRWVKTVHATGTQPAPTFCKVLGSPGDALGIQNRFQNPPSHFFFGSFFWMPFWIFFWSIFNANLPPTCFQIAFKNHQTSMKNRCQQPSPSSLPFWIDFWLIFGRFYNPRNVMFY